MASFVYVARSRAGERVEGRVEANDRRAALLQIERLGQVPVSVTDASAAKAPRPHSGPRFSWRLRPNRMSRREMLVFTTELSDLLASGMTLGNALNCLANRRTGKAGDATIAALRDDIIHGASLSDALSKHPETFSTLYASMIRAGEAGGAIAEVLQRLVAHYERIQETREKVTMALVYPMIVLGMGTLTLIFSMVWVVPKFEVVFRDMGKALPLSDRKSTRLNSSHTR